MTDDRAREALEHLQGAVLELIAAFRAVLDVAEEVVQDPATAARIASGVMSSAAAAATAARPAEPEPPRHPRVTRIQVS